MSSNQYNRTADDSIYLEENRYENVKEHFKQIAAILKLNELESPESKCLIDVGGATGEFLFYVRKMQPKMKLKCAEYSLEFVNASKEHLAKHDIEIVQDDANNLATIKSNIFDFVTTIGVTSIFDDFKPSFEEMIRVAKNGGICINSMLVNQLGVDVIIKYINPETKQIESGWNKFSLKSIGEFLSNHSNVKNFRFEKHVMPFDLLQREDLMRSWTKFNEKGERILWNGLDMEISIYHVISLALR